MQPKISLLLVAFAGAAFGVPAGVDSAAVPNTAQNGCHRDNDSIGKTCKFFNNSWGQAASACCSALAGRGVDEGKSQGLTLWDQPDGAGGRQKFWCNYRVDRGGHHTIDFDYCMGQIGTEFCDGYGGWKNTDFGTVFGECIRQ